MLLKGRKEIEKKVEKDESERVGEPQRKRESKIEETETERQTIRS